MLLRTRSLQRSSYTTFLILSSMLGPSCFYPPLYLGMLTWVVQIEVFLCDIPYNFVLRSFIFPSNISEALTSFCSLTSYLSYSRMALAIPLPCLSLWVPLHTFWRLSWPLQAPGWPIVIECVDHWSHFIKPWHLLECWLLHFQRMIRPGFSGRILG